MDSASCPKHSPPAAPEGPAGTTEAWSPAQACRKPGWGPRVLSLLGGTSRALSADPGQRLSFTPFLKIPHSLGALPCVPQAGGGGWGRILESCGLGWVLPPTPSAFRVKDGAWGQSMRTVLYEAVTVRMKQLRSPGCWQHTEGGAVSGVAQASGRWACSCPRSRSADTAQANAAQAEGTGVRQEEPRWAPGRGAHPRSQSRSQAPGAGVGGRVGLQRPCLPGGRGCSQVTAQHP